MDYPLLAYSTTALVLLLALLATRHPSLVLHPIATTSGLVEMASFKLSQLAERVGLSGLGSVDWESVGADMRGEETAPVVGGTVEKPMRRHARELDSSGHLYYPGLLNAAGNLCFLNATLQSLSSSPLLLTHLSSALSLSSPATPARPSLPVTSSLLALLTALNTPSHHRTSLRPLELARALAASSDSRRALLMSSEQQDAQELLGMIREAVGEEVERALKAQVEEVGFGLEVDKGRRGESVGDPWRSLVSQRVRCMACGYTRDVRHSVEEQVVLSVPPVTHCTLEDLLASYTQLDLLSEYACRRCSLVATRDKLVAQRDRLSAPPAPSPLPPSSPPTNSTTPNPFDLPSPVLAPGTTISASRKDRRKKVQKLVDRVGAVIAAGDFEKELGEEIKIETVRGAAGKVVKFARTPAILTIHLNRSSHYGRSAYKNPCVVSFPELLHLSPFSDYPDGEGDQYRLVSLVVHYGTHSFGHYVAFRRAPEREEEEDPLAFLTTSLSTTSLSTTSLSTTSLSNTSLSSSTTSLNSPSPSPSPNPNPTPTPTLRARPEWYRISDETVEPSSLSSALRANPFMLFYERVGGEEEGRGKRGVVPRVVERWSLEEGKKKEVEVEVEKEVVDGVGEGMEVEKEVGTEMGEKVGEGEGREEVPPG